jgi:acetyl-CoA carboxylase biotin carboxyl carrier protein
MAKAKKASTKKKVAKKTIVKKATPKKTVAKKAIAKKVVGSAKSNLPQTFNIDEITSLLNAVNESGVNELKLEKNDFRITIRQGMNAPAAVVHAAAPAVAAAPAPVAAAAPAPDTAPAKSADAPVADNLITVKSPMIGTFYRSPSPDKPLFVNVGDSIKVGDVLCIVEAMKLFNEIESEVSGTIVKVLVDDASPVEYDQPLFLVEP